MFLLVPAYPGCPGSKVVKQSLLLLLLLSLLPEYRRLYPDNDLVFLQDSAPSHHAKATQNSSRQTRPILLAHKNGYRIRQI